MHVQIGNRYLDAKRYEDAIDEYALSIELDKNFGENAYYNRGYAIIAMYGGDLSGNWAKIDRAIEDFDEARKTIYKRESSLHLLQSACTEGESFSEHVTHQLNLCNVQRNAIDLAIGPDYDGIRAQIRELEEEKKSGKLEQCDDKTKEERAQFLENLNKELEKKGVIQSARSKGRDVEIERLQLGECLPEDDFKSHAPAIAEYEKNGYIGGFKISEIPPIDWCAVIGLLALGFVQLIAGAALVIFTMGGGASFGVSLITEGLSDIITAVKDGIINRTLSLATWAIEKAISLTVAVCCAGFSAMKDVAKTLYSGAKTAASIGSKVLTETVKTGWKMVAKKIGLELAKSAAKELVTCLIDYGIDRSIVPMIQQGIVDKIEKPIKLALLSDIRVKRMLELDRINGNRHYEHLLLAIGRHLLKPDESSTLITMATQIATRIAAGKSSKYATVSQAFSVTKALYGLATFTDEYIGKLMKAIENKAREDKIDEQFEKTAADTVQALNENNEVKCCTREAESLVDEVPKNLPTDGDIDQFDNRLKEQDEKVMADEKPVRTPSGISKELINAASAMMMSTIKGKLINPIVQSSVSYGMNKITASIDKSMGLDEETYRSQRRVIRDQNVGYKKENGNGEGKCDKKKVVLTPREEQAAKKIDALIEDACSGGPSGLPHLGAASDAVDRPIEVYNKEGKLKYIIGEGKSGEPVKIQYHEPKKAGEAGHYTMPGGAEPAKNSDSRNMCMYNVIAMQTGNDPDKLKSKTLGIMVDNKVKIADQATDIMWLDRYANVKLAMGGAAYNGKNPNDAAKIIAKSDGKSGFGFPNAGHPMEHASIRGNTEEHLKAVSEITDRKIEIYDENGTLEETIDARVNNNKDSNTSGATSVTSDKPTSNDTVNPKTTCNDSDKSKPRTKPLAAGEPIKLVRHNRQTDRTKEYFTTVDGTETPYEFHDPHPSNTHFYNMIGQATGIDAVELKTKTTTILDSESAVSNSCVETAARNSAGPKTGFVSGAALNYVTDRVLQAPKCKAAMDTLNEYEQGTKESAKYKRQVVTIPASELNLPEPIYAGQWGADGKLISVWPVRDVRILLQHHDGEQNNKDADVHVQTVYPLLPPEQFRQPPT